MNQAFFRILKPRNDHKSLDTASSLKLIYPHRRVLISILLKVFLAGSCLSRDWVCVAGRESYRVSDFLVTDFPHLYKRSVSFNNVHLSYEF